MERGAKAQSSRPTTRCFRVVRAAAAGAEAPPPSVTAEFLALRNDWVRSELRVDPESLLLEIAAGESMLPGIADGDLLLVDAGERKCRSFGVYVLEIAGERLVKRVQPKLDGSLTLISDNSVYEAEHVPPANAADIRVIGRVIWICGPLRAGR
jgi:phage repressor protein C with HTH and peptisase S24 domain